MGRGSAFGSGAAGPARRRSIERRRPMAIVKVGTFNLNNLFSRFNFKADFKDGEKVVSEGVTIFRFNESALTLRTFKGAAVDGKPEDRRRQIAERIKAMNLDV